MTLYTVNISPKAEENLLDIAGYIAEDNPVRAFTFIEEISDFACNTLSIFPHSGRDYKNTLPDANVQYIPYRDYILIFSVDDATETVDVLLVFNAALNKDFVLKNMNTDR